MTTQLSNQPRKGEVLSRICVYKNGIFVGNYNEGSIRKGKPAYYDQSGLDFYLPYVNELELTGCVIEVKQKIS